MYKIKELKKIDSEHKKQWQQLWESVGDAHFFNSPAWFAAYLEAFPESKPQVYFCYKDGELVAALPLVRTRKFGIKVLASISTKYAFLDRSTLLVQKGKVGLINALIKEIVKENNVYLAEVVERNLPDRNNIQPRPLIEFSTVCPRMIMGEILQSMSRKQRKTMLAKIRQNETHLSYKIFRDDLEKKLRTMFEIENASDKKNRRISIFDKKEIRRLYKAIIKHGKNNAAIGFLYFNGKPIAHRFGYYAHNAFISVHVAYLNEYRRIGPGKILTYFFMKDLRQEGVEIMDFSVGRNDLKKQFSNEEIRQFNVYYSQSQLANFWWRAVLKAKNKAKCIRRVIYQCKINSAGI